MEQLFKKVIIPQKVYDELCHYENHKEDIEKRNWIWIKAVADYKQVRKLEKQLDTGEAEAIVLAKEMNADLLVIDERKGRKTAEKFGLKIIGLLGVLIIAKKRRYLKELKPILDRLIDEVGFRVSNKLYERILKEVDE